MIEFHHKNPEYFIPKKTSNEKDSVQYDIVEPTQTEYEEFTLPEKTVQVLDKFVSHQERMIKSLKLDLTKDIDKDAIILETFIESASSDLQDDIEYIDYTGEFELIEK